MILKSLSLLVALAALFTVTAATSRVYAENAAHILSPSANFSEESGEALFANACQACHMEGATGAVGAGTYPPLANNRKLEVGSYPVHVVLNGAKAMPPIGRMMSDPQVVAVVNYIRTHFGNAYADLVTVQDVSSAR